jgi:hypothetical protein
VLKQWWTRETANTDVSGRCTVRAFLGQYGVEVNARGAKQTADVTVSRGGTAITVALP